jgi:hypothetical protein
MGGSKNMSEKEAIHGLNCPRCGGMVSIPEGQAVVLCPFCDLRSVVRGDRGVRRYQVPLRVTRDQAFQAFQRFLSSSMAIARDVAHKAELSEVMTVHLPFWAVWGRCLGWTFGRKEVGSGDHRRREPREVRFAADLNWNTAACDVGEFGVGRISLENRALEPFNADALHASGMVFEPVGSSEEALEAARADFERRVSSQSGLDEVSQAFTRIVRPRLGLVYYPLWMFRYTYRGRSFQVAVDGFSGEVLYGKAPGNTLYRALVLVGGMAAGAFTGITIPGLILSAGSHNDKGNGTFALVLFAAGMGLMYTGYRKFRYGEHYEYRRYKSDEGIFSLGGLTTNLGQLQDLARQFRRFQ